MPKIMVSIAEENLTNIPRLVEDLRRAGMAVDDVLEALGTVTGSITTDAVENLMAVPGVQAVEWQRDDHRPTT
nr:hypothetical protein [Kibdelosporangium sp. MJ126-NF4]CEL15511.1 hypothetical protein [Kibdelosporangium sp. MJ126-NF4]CTQ92087.1 hypothetical protein [Kibdelosporangium sp. MJ126-NF4]